MSARTIDRVPPHRSVSSTWVGAHLRDLFTAPHAFPFILMLALAVRLGHIFALRSTLWFDHLDLDPRYFDEWAVHIAAGDWMGSRMFFVDPLYPYFLGAVYTLFGHNLLLVRLLQAVMGVGTVGLVGVLGRRLGDAALGNGAALLYAVYGPAIFNEAEIEKTALATLLLLLAVVLTLSRTRSACLFGGVAIGLATLSRANIILLTLPLGLSLVRGADSWHPRRTGRFVAGCLVVLAPVIWRNYHVGGEFALVTSAGQNLYLGNNPYNTGGSYGQLPFVRPAPEYEEDDFRAVAETRTSHAMRPGEVSRYWARAAWSHFRTNPGFAARMLGRKVLLLFNDYEVPDNQDMYFVARYSPVLRWSLLSFGWIVPFAVIGMVMSWERREVRLIVGTLALYAGSVVLFFVVARFRLPIMPFCAVFAALGVRCLARAVEGREFRTVGVAVACLGVCAAVAFRDLPFHDRRVNLALSWHNLGALQAGVGRDDDALASHETAAQLLPDNEYVAADLGLLYLRLGRFPEAERVLLHVVAINAERVDAWVALGDLYQQTDRLDLAREMYRRARALSPDDPEIRMRAQALEQRTR